MHFSKPIKSFLLLSAALALCATPAYAAQARKPVPARTTTSQTTAAYENDSTIPYWGGPYIGAHIGGVWNDFNSAAPGTGPSGSSDSLLGGGQLGYNWQSGRLVFGAEGDWSWQDLNSQNGTAHFSEDWQATIRGRVGYAMGPWLPYATGGLALTKVRAEIDGLGSDEYVRPGFAAGAGVERFFAGNLSGKIEYLYADVPSETTNIGGTNFNGGSGNHGVRAGVNFHF
jgi:outer membrane immunogenic protein